ncbi:MAG: PQQ-binding-like beta-propeller repeat protein [Planctomycetaceae bacterium]|nr:PQQ-binding-like beta-propeller repeat protein [Planctomycetaceae bacterium]
MVARRFAFVISVCVFSVWVYSASNWPSFRGPDQTGVSPDATPPVKWSETENIKWKVALAGDGSDSSPIIWEDKIFLQNAMKVETPDAAPEPAPARQGQGRPRNQKPTSEYKFNVLCLDRNTGKMLWETMVKQVLPHEGHHPDHGFASYSPVTDGKLVWANFGSRGVYCLDLEGKIKWGKDLGQKTIRAGFGEGGSPALTKDNLIVVWDHEGESLIYALNRQTGEIAWKQPHDEKTAWTAPLVVEVGGKEQIVVAGTKQSRGYDAQTGSLIWECSGQTENVIPTPVANKEMVFCVSGFRGAKLQAIKLGRTGDLTGTDAIAWEVNEGTPYVASPLLYDDKLYVNSVNTSAISCYNAQTGQPFYVKQKLEQIKDIYASPVGAAGNVYYVGRNGVTYVLKNADTLEVVSVNKRVDGIDSTPALYGSAIYLKGKKNLYCIENKQ